jgi:large subunit ribosomal protein L17
MVTSLFKHDRIQTTDAKAKELKRWADHLITLAKRGDLHARRQALSIVREKEVVHKLFEEAAGRYADTSGGYTRSVKVGRRRGDAALITMIELMAPDKSKKKKKASKKKARPEIEEQGTPAEVREDKTPEAKGPGEKAPEDVPPEETMPEDIMPEETMPEETVPEETMPEETMKDQAGKRIDGKPDVEPSLEPRPGASSETSPEMARAGDSTDIKDAPDAAPAEDERTKLNVADFGPSKEPDLAPGESEPSGQSEEDDRKKE